MSERKSKAETAINGYRSTFVAIARKLGFLNDEAARRADALCSSADAPGIEGSSQDILVDAGLLDADQVRAVDAERVGVDLDGHLDDRFRAANKAIQDVKTSADRLSDVTRPMAAIKRP